MLGVCFLEGETRQSLRMFLLVRGLYREMYNAWLSQYTVQVVPPRISVGTFLERSGEHLVEFSPLIGESKQASNPTRGSESAESTNPHFHFSHMQMPVAFCVQASG